MAKKRKPRRKITRNKAGEYQWHLYGGNGEHLATGEGHGSKADAQRAFMDAADAIAEYFMPGARLSRRRRPKSARSAA